MKKFNDYIKESNDILPLELDKRYRLEKGDVFMEFYITSIDEDKDEVYMKVVEPGLAFQGVTLSSLLKAEPVLIEEEEKEIEDTDED
jgi:hypothetical protein